MKKGKTKFTKVIQDPQDFGSDDEHMVSRVFFDLNVDNREIPGLYCNIKQVVGSSYETGDIEVSPPVGYNGPFDYTAFRDAVERYYRSLVGSGGHGIRVSGGGNIRMRNNTFISPAVVEFDIDDSGGSAW